MKKVLVKSLRNLSKIPTLDDLGMTVNDLQGMRLVGDHRLGQHTLPTPLVGDNIKFEQGVHDAGGQTIPGFTSGYKRPNDPKKEIQGTFVYPPDVSSLAPYHRGGRPDLPNKFQFASLLGILDKPDWRAGREHGRQQVEGYQPHGFNPDAFVRLQNEINLRNPISRADWNASADDIMYGRNRYSRPDYQGYPAGISHNILSQLPATQDTRNRNISLNNDDNLLQGWDGASLDMFLPSQGRKVASEPMDIAMQLLKENLFPHHNDLDYHLLSHDELAYLSTQQGTPPSIHDIKVNEEIARREEEFKETEANLNQYYKETGNHPESDFIDRDVPIRNLGRYSKDNDVQIMMPMSFTTEFEAGDDDWQAKNASEPMEIAMQLLKNYDVEEVKRLRMGEGAFEDYIDHQIADAQPGMDRKLPRPYGLMSHKALGYLSNGFYEGDIREMLDDPNFAFDRNDEGKLIWNARNLGAGNPDFAHPEHLGFMIENQLEGTPIDFDEIRRESYLRELENTPWELNEPRTSKFLGLEMKPSSTTDFSSAWAYGPADTLEQVEGQKNRGFQDIYTGEPMDLTMRLLKRELHPGENQYKHRYKMPNRDDVHPEWYDWIQETLDNPAEYEGIADDFQQPDINHLASATSREDFFEKLYDLHNFQVDDARPPFDDIEGKYRDFTDVPFSEETGFTRSEPMDIAMRLLKERVSPEAKRHKLEYDKKYESSPERVKYREELNRERRRRHIMGRGGPDMSHTKDHTIVPESPHTNRARHFKDKGTLL